MGVNGREGGFPPVGNQPSRITASEASWTPIMTPPRRRAGFLVLVGLGMLGLWTVLLGTGAVPELRTAPYEIGSHLVAELLTALAALAAGIGLLRGSSWAPRVYPVALGLLLYTVLNSAGYYVQRGDLAMVAMFTVLTVAALLLTIGHVRGDASLRRPTAPGEGHRHA